MWNLTPDYLSSMKEELKGRRAAIQARYADEVKSIEEDIKEIETLERVAYAFAVKHLSDADAEASADAPPKPEPEAELETVAVLEGGPVDHGRDDAASGPAAREPKGGVSRWRMRLDGRSEAEAAEQ